MEETVKTNDIKIINRVLQDYDFSHIKTNLSYINQLFPHFGHKAEILLLCHIPPDMVIKDETRCKDESTDLDVTGSPLSHSYGDDSFNATLILAKRNWLKREEKYQPIPKQVATTMLNLIHEEMGFDANWTLPKFALCDIINDKSQIVCQSGSLKVKNKVILLGSHYDSSWFITYNVTVSPMKSLMSIRNGCNDLLIQHCKQSSASKNNVDVTVISTHELCGTKSEMIDWREQLKIDFKGYLKIETVHNDLGYLPSSRGSSNSLEAEIMSGSHESPLHDLWNQILLLDKYLSILEDYRRKNIDSRYCIMPLNFPIDFLTPYYQDESVINSNLNRLLVRDEISGVDNDDVSEIPIRDGNIYQMKLTDLVKELSRRENIDFTDRFWRIIRGSENYIKMTDCIHAVFEEMAENNYRLQLNDMNETRFAKMALESESGKVNSLAGSLSLELAIDIGLEKISRDYICLLANMNIVEAYEIRKTLGQVSAGEFEIDKYRDKLISLARIHISLEFLQLIQNQFDCRYDVTHLIFDIAFKKYCSADSPVKYENLSQNLVYTLDMPAPREFITTVETMAPSSWMCTLSSTQSIQKITTVTHYSRLPIFPPNIYKSDTFGKQKEDEMYHVTTALITYLKYK